MINYRYEIRFFLDYDEYNLKFDVNWKMTVFGFKRINIYLNNDRKCLKTHSLQRILLKNSSHDIFTFLITYTNRQAWTI